ncbi:MAG: restriction endonuclease subunit S [Bacteroidaceae bacterium]|nr:restriction endonuclease subunit S [Bacteroidaceae bacterium]
MREGWTYKKLGDVCESELGKTLNSAKDKGELHPYLCAVNVLWDKIDISSLKETKFEDSELERYSVKQGDLLVCEGGDIGRAAIWDKDYPILYQNALHRLRFSENILPRFCLMYLMNLKEKGDLDAKYGKGVTIKHLVKSSLLSIPIPIPPLSEQERIVSELDLLSSIIEKKKAQLKEYDKLAQSIFYDMFGDPVTNEKGWEVKRLEDVCYHITDGDHMPPPKSEKGIPFLTIANIDKDTRNLDFSNSFFVPQEYYDNLKEERKARINDLLYTVTGSYGIPVIIRTTRPFCFQRHIALIRPNQEKVLTMFLFNWALCPSVKNEADKVATGIAQKTVGLNSLRQFVVPLPPLSLQQSFASKIEAIERQKALVQQSIVETKTMFDYTMDKYFG